MDIMVPGSHPPSIVLWTLMSFLLLGPVHALAASPPSATSCLFTNVIELNGQTPPVSTDYLTTTLVRTTIDCQDKGCVDNRFHVNAPVPSVYFSSTTTISTTTELYYECSPTSSPTKLSSETRHSPPTESDRSDNGHRVQDRNAKSSLLDVYENSRGYHRFVESSNGHQTTLVSAFTTLSSSGPFSTSIPQPTILPSLTLEPPNETVSCTSVVWIPSPAFILASVPGYTFRNACGTTTKDVEACPYLCGDFAPQRCSAVDLSNVTNAGPCHRCPPPCSNGITTSSAISPSTPGTNFAGPTLTNQTLVFSVTSNGASCTSVLANATPSPAIVLEQNTWRVSCGQTVQDVVSCPYLCEEFSGCAGVPSCGRRCSISNSSNGVSCEQCLLPCTNGSTATSGPTTSTPASSILPSVTTAPPTFFSNGSSSPAISICTPVPADAASSPNIFVNGFNLRVNCGRTIEDVTDCPYLCDFPGGCSISPVPCLRVCAFASELPFIDATCEQCLPPCTNGSTSPPASTSPTIPSSTIPSSVANGTSASTCTSVPANATSSPAVTFGKEVFWRLTCGQTAEDVAACPYLCGYLPGGATDDCDEDCSGKVARACELNRPVPFDPACEQCLPPCTNGSTTVPGPMTSTPLTSIAISVPTLITNGTAASSFTSPPFQPTCFGAACIPSSTCNPATPTESGAVVIPSFAGVHFRIQCGTTPEDVAQCPFLCGNMCADADLSIFGAGPCKECLPPCSTLPAPPSTSNGTAAAVTAARVTAGASTATSNVTTPTCTTFPPTATPSPAVYDAQPSVDIFLRQECGTNYLEVLECPYLCGFFDVRGCSPWNVTDEEGGVPCEKCLPPCSNYTPAFIPTTASLTLSATAIEATPTSTCIDLPPAINYEPTLYEPVLDKYYRQHCGITPETSEACPWLCGYYSNLDSDSWKMCSSTNLTANYTDPILGPLPCVQCPVVCPSRLTNPFPNLAPNTTLPVNYTIDIPEIPTFPPTCTSVQASPSPALSDPATDVSYRHSCGTTAEEVQECAFLCGFPSSYIRTCIPSNITELFAPWYNMPCEQCLLPCGSNGTANSTTAVPSASTSASASSAATTASLPLARRSSGAQAGTSPFLARATCPMPPRSDCPYICADADQDNQIFCSNTVYDSDSSISCISCSRYPHDLLRRSADAEAGNSPILARATCPRPPRSDCSYICADADQEDQIFCSTEAYDFGSSVSCITCSGHYHDLLQRSTSADAGNSPVLARAVCPPRGNCPYVCADVNQGRIFCSNKAYDSDSSIGCVSCPGRYHDRRQTDPVLAGVTPLTGEAEWIVADLATGIFIYQLLYSGINLTTACQQLSVTALSSTRLNGTRVKEFICNFGTHPIAPPYTPLEQTVGFAAAIYAAEIAGGFAGGCNLTSLCENVPFSVVTGLLFDGQRARDFVCSKASLTSLATTATGTATGHPGVVYSGHTTPTTSSRTPNHWN